MKFKTGELEYIKHQIDRYSSDFTEEQHLDFEDVMSTMDTLLSKVAFTNKMQERILEKVYFVINESEIFNRYSLDNLINITNIIKDETMFNNFVEEYIHDNNLFTDMNYFEDLIDSNQNIDGWENIANQYQGLCAENIKPEVIEINVYETEINNSWTSYDEFKESLKYDFLIGPASEKIRSELSQTQKR
ncbi:hypothetical protein [Mycoplasma sp. 2634B]|uniref:hypothetical protein n=1 Tax=Mycoplasma sp. 2634B TaxID=3401692 RepID=UPI003AAF6EF6